MIFVSKGTVNSPTMTEPLLLLYYYNRTIVLICKINIGVIVQWSYSLN